MATYTSNYAWTKPEGSDPVDIGVLNNNLDSQDSIVHNAYMQLAPVFSTASTYAVDDVVLYSDNLYKCHTAVTVAGDWDATKWTQVKVTDIVGGGGGGGGHTIENASGTAMTQRDALQFKGGLSVSDDSTNDRTVVSDDYELITWDDWQTIVENHEENLHPNAIITDVPGADGDVSVDLMTKLWENPSPTSAMADGTAISLSSSDYDYLMVVYSYSKSVATAKSVIVPKDSRIYLDFASTSSNGCETYRRNLNYVSATSYTASSAYEAHGATATTVNNDYVIPTAIYGIKTTASVRISAIAENVSTSADKCMLSDGVTSVEDRLDANTFGTAVDISGYNTAQTKYTCSSDGYLYLAANDTSGYVVANVSGSGIPAISHSAVNAGIRYNYNSLYVKKGMKIYISVSSGSITAYFYPIS